MSTPTQPSPPGEGDHLQATCGNASVPGPVCGGVLKKPPSPFPLQGARVRVKAGSLETLNTCRILFTLLALALLAIPATPSARAVDYLADIKPLLRERCYACHGALKQKKGLRLDTVAAMLRGSTNGPVLVRGEPAQSGILQRVTSTNLDERMPPEHEGQPFTAAQLNLLREWIAAGAPAPAQEKGETDPKEHWAFRECIRPPAPPSAKANWIQNPIDAFIAQGHTHHGLTPQPEAPPEILLRRLYLDLIGVPPPAEEIASATPHVSSSRYAKTVDRLLDDPRYGERWARHWMDIWRYSDWYGLGDELRNSQKHIWHWRDWLIQALNADTPYDEMIRLMLAADELHPNELDKLRATGFLARNYFLFNRNQWLEETVEHVSKAFLGLTMNCAKCHDHKYDPIRQVDFYQMRAFFEPYHVRLDVVPGEPDLVKDGIPCVFDGLPEAPTYRFIRGQENQPDKSAVMTPKPPEFLAFKELRIQPVNLPEDAYEPERRAWVIEGHLTAAEKRLHAAKAAVPAAKQTLIAALRQEADLLEADGLVASPASGTAGTNRASARLAVDDARAAFNVAEATLEFATAELVNIQRRAEAMQTTNTGAVEAEGSRAKNVAAIRSEREMQVAKARLSLVEAEKRLAKAADDKREAATKEVREARDALEKARKTAQSPIKPDENYARFIGAKWTPTRFLSTTADDPAVKFSPQSTGRRTALADWLTDARNPLTARVAVNHIWTRHFGTPLVPTLFDFGRKGTPPTHPELLDWLARELIESGWSMKHLHRLIVCSATYRLSSSLAGAAANLASDSDNVYLWRRNPIRLEAEVVRDSILSLAGTLDATLGGPPVRPADQAESKRRSLYFFHSNNDRNLFLSTFDGAGVKECYRRDQSIVPQQALALSNSKLALESSRQIAARLFADCQSLPPSSCDEAFIRRAMSTMLGIESSPAEIAACRQALEDWRTQQKPSGGAADSAARAHLVWALLNHNDFVTLP